MASAPPTPTSRLPFQAVSLSLAQNTVVQADPQPFNNTKQILVYNPSSATEVLMQVADLSGGLPAAGTITTANSVRIPAESSITLAIGPEGDRQPLGTVAFWTAGNGSNLGIIFKQTASAAAVLINVTYVQTVGGFTGPS